jgi:Ni,Fe-hydrogenase I cytochrome b subunit
MTERLQLFNQYPILLRLIHWLTTLMIIVLLVFGFWMTDRAGANLWDELTNTLYSTKDQTIQATFQRGTFNWLMWCNA